MIDPTGFSVSKLLSAIAKSEIDVTYKGKFLTMLTEFDKNSSKWSYSSTDYKNYIKFFFEHFPAKLLDPQKSTFGDVILGIKLF